MSKARARFLSRQSIAIDMDHTITDTGRYLCDWVNDRFGTSYSDETYHTLYQTLPVDQRDVMEAHVEEGRLMRELSCFPMAAEVIAALNETYAVFIATSAMQHPKTIPHKVFWLRENLPFLDQMQVIFCGPKQVLGTDYLIDDSSSQFEGFKGTPLLYDAPGNRDVTGFKRVKNWQDVADILLKD